MFPNHSCYRWRNRAQEPDLVEDTSDTELEGSWGPGLLASPTLLHGVIVGSRVAARRAAVRGAWPDNDDGTFWRPVILERLRAAGAGDVMQHTVDLLCKALREDYQALFHATRQMAGGTEAPSHWLAVAARRLASKPPEAGDKDAASASSGSGTSN